MYSDLLYRFEKDFNSVGIKGHAVADAVAEAPTGVARALLYIVRGSPSQCGQSSDRPPSGYQSDGVSQPVSKFVAQ